MKSPDHQPTVLVIGSLNMDLVIRAQRIAGPGETIAGQDFHMFPGGKGANQAVAAAHAGARTHMLGRIGNDDFASRLEKTLEANGVCVDALASTEGVNTGVAMISVDSNGENAIVVSAGANGKLTPADLDEQADLIQKADVVLCQLEVPIDTVIYAMELCRHHKTPVILNPAPAPTSVSPILCQADIIILNAHELSALAGEPVTDAHSARLASSVLLGSGARTVVVTLGRRGSMVITADAVETIKAFDVQVTDTTGAGDAFCGAFAVAWCRDDDVVRAARFGNAAGALACMRFGAQASIPHREAIEQLLKRRLS